jgi:hypothetical protein
MKNISTAANGVLGGVMSTARLSRNARFCLAGALSAIAALSFIVAAAPAQAALSDCPAQHVCVWTGANYTGQIFRVSGFANYTDFPAYIHDNVRSAASTTRRQRMCLIDWVNGSAVTRLTLQPGARFPNLALTGLRGPDAVRFC